MLKICSVIAIVSIITGITASSDTVELKFLKGVNRLNSRFHFDYYFSCSVVGRFIQWQYNEEPLDVFHSNNDVGDSVVTDRDNYIYTASLLSSEPMENNNRAMDSLLIISLTSVTIPSNFTVTCTNGIHLKREMAGSEVDSVGKSSNDDNNLVLDYITSNTIVKNGTTHIFMCGAQDSPQLLQANGPPISFSSTDEVGFHKAPDATTFAVREQGIFISRNLFNTTSVLIVADEFDVNVICFYGTRLASVQSLVHVPKDTSPTPEVDQNTSSRGIVTTMGTKTDMLHNVTTTTTSNSSDAVSGSTNNIKSNTALINGAIGATPAILIVIGTSLVIIIIIIIITVNRSRPKSDGSPSMFYYQSEGMILKHNSKTKSIYTTRVHGDVENPIEYENNMKDLGNRRQSYQVCIEYSSPLQRMPSTLEQNGPSTLEQNGPSTLEQNGPSTLYQGEPRTSEQGGSSILEEGGLSTPEQERAATSEKEGTSTIKQRGLKSLGPKTPQESSSLVQRESGSPVQNDVEVLVNRDKHHTAQLDIRNAVQSVGGKEIMPQQSDFRPFKTSKHRQETHAYGGHSMGDGLSQVEEGGAQFAELVNGKLRRAVYIKSDGQTFARSDKLEEKQERQSNLMRVLKSWCKPAQDLLDLVVSTFNAAMKSLQLQMAEYWAYKMPLLHDWEKKVHASRAASRILHKQLHDEGGLEGACLLTSKGIISTDNLLSRSTLKHRKGAQNTEGSLPCSPSPWHILAAFPLEVTDDN